MLRFKRPIVYTSSDEDDDTIVVNSIQKKARIQESDKQDQLPLSPPASIASTVFTPKGTPKHISKLISVDVTKTIDSLTEHKKKLSGDRALLIKERDTYEKDLDKANEELTQRKLAADQNQRDLQQAYDEIGLLTETNKRAAREQQTEIGQYLQRVEEAQNQVEVMKSQHMITTAELHDKMIRRRVKFDKKEKFRQTVLECVQKHNEELRERVEANCREANAHEEMKEMLQMQINKLISGREGVEEELVRKNEEVIALNNAIKMYVGGEA